MMEPQDRFDRSTPQQPCHSARSYAQSVRHAQTVRAPLPHEGVGLALRCAYLPRASDLPSDIGDLLDQLC